MAKVQILTALQHHFISVAPPYLTQSNQILGLQQGILSIAVANATIAAKLRQLAPELTILMQNRGCEVSGIRVKVQVSFDRPHPRATPRRLSKTAQKTLHEFMLGLGDTPLKLALKKMVES